jgi:hypothetical protein
MSRALYSLLLKQQNGVRGTAFYCILTKASAHLACEGAKSVVNTRLGAVVEQRVTLYD